MCSNRTLAPPRDPAVSGAVAVFPPIALVPLCVEVGSCPPAPDCHVQTLLPPLILRLLGFEPHIIRFSILLPLIVTVSH